VLLLEGHKGSQNFHGSVGMFVCLQDLKKIRCCVAACYATLFKENQTLLAGGNLQRRISCCAFWKS